MSDEARDHSLSGYLQTARANSPLMEQRGGALFRLLADISDVFAIGHETFRPKVGSVGAAFFPASYSSFLAATNLAASLHVIEAYKPMRGCLESAAYTLHAERDPEAYRRWKSRPAATELSDDPVIRKEQIAARTRVGKEFSVSRIALEITDVRLRNRFIRLHEETIDYGHYNFPAFKRHFEIVDPQIQAVRARVLSNEEANFVACLRKIAEVSLTALEVVDSAFADQWNSLLIRSRIAGLTRQLERRHASRLSRRARSERAGSG